MNITYSTVVDTLNEIVNDYPGENMYTMHGPDTACIYSHDATPVCIVGHLLDRLDMLSLIDKWKDQHKTWRMLVNDGHVVAEKFTDATNDLLDRVQAQQDGHPERSWNEVVANVLG